MATPLHTLRSSPIVSSASSNHRMPDSVRQKSTPPSNWWSPIFGWSSDPDYIQNPGNKTGKAEQAAEVSDQKTESESRRTRSKFSPGCFTEEKARELRKLTMETSAFHDIMYHSAIASRKASDVSGRYDL